MHTYIIVRTHTHKQIMHTLPRAHTHTNTRTSMIDICTNASSLSAHNTSPRYVRMCYTYKHVCTHKSTHQMCTYTSLLFAHRHHYMHIHMITVCTNISPLYAHIHDHYIHAYILNICTWAHTHHHNVSAHAFHYMHMYIMTTCTHTRHHYTHASPQNHKHHSSRSLPRRLIMNMASNFLKIFPDHWHAWSRMHKMRGRGWKAHNKAWGTIKHTRSFKIISCLE